MADDTKPEDTPAPKIVPQTGEATAAAATTGSPAAGRAAGAAGGGGAARWRAGGGRGGERGGDRRQSRRDAASHDHAGRTAGTGAASCASAGARSRGEDDVSCLRRWSRRREAGAGRRQSGDARCRRHVAAAEPSRVDGAGLGSVLSSV